MSERPKNGIYKKANDMGTGVGYFRMGDLFRHDRISSHDPSYLLAPLTDSELSKHRLRSGDLLFCRTSVAPEGVGKCSIVRDDENPFVPASNLIRVRMDPELCDSRFIYYYFSTDLGGKSIRSFTRGAAVYTITGSDIASVPVPAPCLGQQRQVADLIERFDDLIENNRRRIEVLDEMAGLIYREWFVHFRFPGHEDVELVDSALGRIPEGWEAATVASVAQVNKRSLRKGDDVGEVLYLDISAVGPRSIEPPEAMPFVEAPGRARRLVSAGDTIWSTVRPNRRSHALLVDPPANLVCSTGFAVLTPKSVPSSFLFEMTSTDEFTAHLTGRATGSAYPAVRPPDFECFVFARPPSSLLTQFDETVGPMHQLQHMLAEQNGVLVEARDLLLPRLVSGELDVSELDLDSVA